MKQLTADELREMYLSFFESKGHVRISGASVIPENDPTVLFTTAGMHPLVPYLMGQMPHPAGTRLTDVQKCVRTGDIDEVGDAAHLTFFEMLGNWSLNDYFKKEAISWSFEFLTQKLGFKPEQLNVTVFRGEGKEGDEGYIPADEEAVAIWKSVGIPDARIFRLPREDNWWGPAGTTGPCGPDTEMFIDTGKPKCGPDCRPGCHCGKYVEIWNDVFMQYNKTADGKYVPLEHPNVDTGMGVERVTAFLEGVPSAYQTELFAGLFKRLQELSGNKEADYSNRSARVVVEHIRAATFLLADNVKPGNVDQGYVLRRLIRRAIREARKLGLVEAFTSKLADVVIDEYGDIYPELVSHRDVIHEELDREEKQFAAALEKGTREFNKMIDRVPDFVVNKQVSGKNAFNLYETYGFPIELTVEMAKERGFKVDLDGFKKAAEEHQKKSQAGAEQKFHGGLADHSEATAQLHTATHLLDKALKVVLSDDVHQCGSNITAERLRFDFNWPEKVTPEQLKAVEDLVNQQIQRNLPVVCKEMTLEEAKKTEAIGIFESKYGERVKVYSIGDFSTEICGGPHANNTSELGHFKIVKEESSSRGIRRIKAILEK